MCLFRKKKPAIRKESTQVKQSLGRDFYSIFHDEAKTDAEAKNTESEPLSFGKLFYDIFDDSVNGKNLTTGEKHRLYMDRNRKNIISAYNGDNVRELSLQYRCSQKEILQILRESIAKNDKTTINTGT